jgi:hypothetical protein
LNRLDHELRTRHPEPGEVHAVSHDVPPGDKAHKLTTALAVRVGDRRMAIVSRALVPRETTEAMEAMTGRVPRFYAVARDGATIWLFPEGGRDYLTIEDAIRRGVPWLKV